MTTPVDLMEHYALNCAARGVKPQPKRRKPISTVRTYPIVYAAPGFEKMLADYRKRKPKRRNPRVSTVVLSYPKVKMHPYNPLRRWPDTLIKVPPHHKDDIAFRRKHRDLDRWLAECEVAGHIARRYASFLGDGQVITFPEYPGSLNDGATVDWSVDTIMSHLDMIANT